MNQDSDFYGFLFIVIFFITFIISKIFKLNFFVALFYLIGALIILTILIIGILFIYKKISDLDNKKNSLSLKDNLPEYKSRNIKTTYYTKKVDRNFSRNLAISSSDKVNCLYHFTDPRNIPSIKKYGLLSWYELNKKNIYHIPASNSLSRNLDIRRNLEDYVRLSLNKNHPMFARAINEGRVKNLVWLKIDPIVMNFPDTLFSNDNATSNRAVINNNKDTALKSKSSQAEVLVKKRIDPKYIIFPRGT